MLTVLEKLGRFNNAIIPFKRKGFHEYQVMS